MPLTLGSNIASLSAQRRLSEGAAHLSRTFERLASGQRLNRAADDSAGIAIADSLRTDRKVFEQGIRNLNDGVSVLNVADSTVSQLALITTRIRELATQAANGTFSKNQRAALDTEAQALSKEYLRLVKSTAFNGLKIFDGTVSDMNFQGGYGAASSIGGVISGTMANGTFSIAATFSESGVAVQLGDLNGDGNLDLVSAMGSNTVVRLGNGDGSMGAAATYSAGAAIVDMKLVDFNNDGVLDSVSTLGNSRLSVRLGVGDGTFGAAASWANSSTPTEIDTADFNNDGVMDIAAGSSVFLGNGNGTFRSAINSGGGSMVQAGDFNGDGNIDLFSEDGGILLGRGDGTFGSPTTYAIISGGDTLNAIRVGDLNGDGKLDLVSAGYNASTGQVTLRLGNGNGTFGALSQFDVNWADRAVTDVAIADVTGDGTVDLLVTGWSNANSRFGTYVGNGNGTFGASRTYDSPGGTSDALAVGDLNNDGVADVVTLDGTGSRMTLLGRTKPGENPLLDFSLKTISGARAAMSLMDQKLTSLASQQSVIGALQSRLETAVRAAGGASLNYASAEGRIRDIDVGYETSEATRFSIISQAATAVLAQANQQPQIALQLLK